ncbi:hypothetical protein Trydic_g2599 [Trypoxylus dichotomus]
MRPVNPPTFRIGARRAMREYDWATFGERLTFRHTSREYFSNLSPERFVVQPNSPSFYRHSSLVPRWHHGLQP